MEVAVLVGAGVAVAVGVRVEVGAGGLVGADVALAAGWIVAEGGEVEVEAGKLRLPQLASKVAPKRQSTPNLMLFISASLGTGGECLHIRPDPLAVC